MNEIITKFFDVFTKFEPKDWITLSASAIAILLSVLSFRQKSGEGRLALRKQLTDILEKLTELNMEIAKFAYFRLEKSDYPPNYGRLLNDQRRFLVRQASFVASKIKDIVSPYEYLVIAGAFDGVDDVSQAEHYFQLAISNSTDLLDRGIASRSYARFLFSQGSVDEAKKQYEKAVKCFSVESDRFHHYRGDTYERWANVAKDWSSEAEVNDLIEKASIEYGKLKNPRRREQEVERVRELLETDKEKPPKKSLKPAVK